MSFWKVLPIVNFTVASLALTFQVTWLAPWHDELDRSFGRLKKQRDRENALALERLCHIERKMSVLDHSFNDLRSQRNEENRTVIELLDTIASDGKS